MNSSEEHQKMIDSVKAIQNGPRALQLYMDICVQCGTCSLNCHVTQGNTDKRTNPALRSNLIRDIYDLQSSILGRIRGALSGGPTLDNDELDQWARDFYECSGCRRCARFCPFGIDNSVITRKGRAIVHNLGKTPKYIVKTQEISDETGNDEGQGFAVFMDSTQFLESEMLEMTGHEIKIPVDKEGADILFVPASADLISFPETHMGSAIFFYAAGLDWTMSSEAFDGANFGLFSGDDAHMKRKNKLIHDACQKLGVKTLVVGECGHAYRIAKRMAPGFWGKLPYDVTNILLIAAEYIREGKIKTDPSKNDLSVTYHDPCNFSRSCGITNEPREVLKACVNDLREMTPNHSDNWCCGGGGGLAVMDGRENVELFDDTFLEYRMNIGGKQKLKQILDTGAQYVAAPCSNCKRQLMQLMDYHKTEVQAGGVMDLFANAVIL